jgi:formylglycine-generating enzyme required for sulfatase activity
MKQIFYTLVAFVLVATLSFNSTIGDWFDVKQFVQVKDDLWVSKYEVSNADYRKFIIDVSNSNEPLQVHSVLPDTLVWRNDLANTEPFVKFYFRNNSYDNYPVVGIGYEAAKEYCKWLTEKYNQNPHKKFQKVLFKLLSKEEWVFAANKGDTSKVYTWGTGFIQNNRKQYLCNYKHTVFTLDSATKKYIESPEPNAIGGTTVTAPIHSFYPNSFGIYNMCGNVAEMIEEKGIAKGGSFLDPAYNVRISSEKMYNQPQADIGFRIALKIIEK